MILNASYFNSANTYLILTFENYFDILLICVANQSRFDPLGKDERIFYENTTYGDRLFLCRKINLFTATGENHWLTLDAS